MEEDFALFLEFYYPELKDLTVKFLTLVSSIFTFSVVFAEKVVVLKDPIGKRHIPIIASWVLFTLALVLGGLGIYNLFIAAEIAHGGLIFQYEAEFVDVVRSVYITLDIAGCSFALGLVMLAVSAVMKIMYKESKKIHITSA